MLKSLHDEAEATQNMSLENITSFEKLPHGIRSRGSDYTRETVANQGPKGLLGADQAPFLISVLVHSELSL